MFKSHNLVLEADVATDCNITSLLAYDWLVKSPDTVARRDDRKKMVLPPGLLNYGKYSIKLKVGFRRKLALHAFWNRVAFSIFFIFLRKIRQHKILGLI